MKLSDYVFSFFSDHGVNHVFTLTGGGIMHLVDSMGRSGMKYICCHHEQAASIAAQAYAMYTEQPSLCLITTGPGGTNALTGTAAAYMDSTPVFFISGQVKRDDFAKWRGVRQFGAQENDIVSMTKPVVKYATLVSEPEMIAYELEKAWYLAVSGRKGPVWLDIPLDVQEMEICESDLVHFSPKDDTEICNMDGIENPYFKGGDDVKEKAECAIRLLEKSRRPILLVGQGAVASGAAKYIRDIVQKADIPVLATWRALDFMGTDETNFFGSPGLQAPRYSNLILQTCDLLIVLGSRLDNMITAFSEEHFAFLAEKVIVDVDRKEIEKLAMSNITAVVADVKDFARAFLQKMGTYDFSAWNEACQKVKKMYPLLEEKQDDEHGVDLYRVTDAISRQADSSDVIVISSTSRCNTAGHIAFQRQRDQKSISSMGLGSMGFALPSAVGAYFASGGKRVLMLEGDGSLQLNIQELETVASNQIPVKMFIFSNQGYAAITMMQERNFDGFYVGSNEESGVFMPDLEKISYAYGIPYDRIEREEDIQEKVAKALNSEGAFILDIAGSLHFDEIPKCISKVDTKTGKRISAFLENPYPFLEKKELDRVMDDLLRI